MTRHRLYTILSTGAILATTAAAIWLMIDGANRLRSRIYTAQSAAAHRERYYEQGVQAGAKAKMLDAQNAYAYFQHAQNLFGNNQPTEAIADLAAAEPIISHLPTLLRVKGQAEIAAGKYEDSVATLERYLLLDPEPESQPGAAYFLAGQSLYRSKQYAKTTAMMQRAEHYDDFSTRGLQLRLQSALLLNQPRFSQYLFRRYLAETSVETVKHTDVFAPNMALQKSEIFLEFANAVRGYLPDSAGIMKPMALAHAKLGQESEARQYIAELYKKTPDDAEVSLTEADVSTLLGDTSGARAAYTRYLELNPRTPLRTQIEANIAELK